jgi:hypothetical protein
VRTLADPPVRTHYDALARTTLLLNREFFSGEADEAKIADALLATTVRLEADEKALGSRAGQEAFVASFILIARLGIGIELAAPDVQLINAVAPLRRPTLVAGLVELGGDLVPGAGVRTERGESDDVFVFGAARSDAVHAVQVTATDFTAKLTRGGAGAGCTGDLPLGAFVAAAAVAPIALEAAVPRIEAAVGRSVRKPRPTAGPPVHIDLRVLFPELEDDLAREVGDIDAISGGAITHALLYCLLRFPDVRARVRVVEEQVAELSNVNRYALLRASDDGRLKIDQLKTVATPTVRVSGVPILFTKETRECVFPLSERTVVGVDDVEARWWVQEENPSWLAVGATGNHLAQLTIHVPDGPCAGCAHTTPLPPQTIPTISFVSFWAGLLQACALLCRRPLTSQGTVAYPFALGGPAPMHRFPLVPSATCPVGCPASAHSRR